MLLILLINTTTSTIRNILSPLTKSMPQFTAKLHTKNNVNNRTSNHHKTPTDLREQVVFVLTFLHCYVIAWTKTSYTSRNITKHQNNHKHYLKKKVALTILLVDQKPQQIPYVCHLLLFSTDLLNLSLLSVLEIHNSLMFQ